MTEDCSLNDADETAVRRLAECVALKIRAGDAVALHGDLGAGKTTFARALIRALAGDDTTEVPSPTFSLAQTYDTPRLTISHLDFYRLAGEAEAAELGISELLSRGAIIVEWPERAPSLLGEDVLDIDFSEGRAESTRKVSLSGRGSWGPRLARIGEIRRFLDVTAWSGARVHYLQGDASARAYARLGGGTKPALLMDWPRQPDGPPIRDGLPYSRIAHLAEGVHDFVEVQRFLASHGLRVPAIWAQDLERGLLVTEDLGDLVFGRLIAEGKPMLPPWEAATDTLLAMRGLKHRVPAYDKRALAMETELLTDWYWPFALGSDIPEAARAEFLALWSPVLDRILAGPTGLVLRDYHSPNLMWLPDAEGVARVGLIDFQDAVDGHQAYDLVSLLQDARLDVPVDMETALLARYMAAAGACDAHFDPDDFAFAYAALGAQRNTKILGIFARLCKRDGKPAYLVHIPRIWRYLERDLAHPQLGGLRAFYDRNFPPALRSRVLEA
jgi:hypothetical protein